jgi:hypothetical protein
MTATIKINATLCFTQGFGYRVCEKLTAEAMRTNDAAKQRIAILEVKAGIMAAILKPAAEANAELAAYVSGVLNKPGKDRTEAEAKAENAARTKVARLLAAYEIANLDNRGGAANAKKRGTKNKAAPSKKTTKKIATTKVQLATYVSPTITKADDWANHCAFVTKNLGLTFDKAKPYLDKKAQAQYLKALSNFKIAITKIKA